ncbi:MAG: BMP family ABC transporter substrate-binding protein [Deltaproteobacteria bacterium]|nr:MAG: BMP family ABC transporter substrate-binding protein [Deltaproteobacteria bacterium]
MKKFGLFLAVAAVFALAGEAFAARSIKAGFIYSGPIGDHGWTYQHDQGRLALEKELGAKTIYIENVKDRDQAAVEQAIKRLANSGCELIFATSFGFMNPTVRLAKQFERVKFEHVAGYKRGSNVSVYAGRFYEGRAVIGTIAGKMTKTDKIGYIASFPIPEVIRGIDAFTLAARRVNPKAVVKVVWLNTWHNPSMEGDAAKKLIRQGCDILAQQTDSAEPLKAAEEAGVHGFGHALDMSSYAPKAQLTAIVDDWGNYYISRAKAVMDGTWKTSDSWQGLKSGMVQIAPYGPAVPKEVRKLADEVKNSIIDGTFHPFQGPIKNQAGELVVKEGETLSDSEMLGLTWYVEGVEGSIPKK